MTRYDILREVYFTSPDGGRIARAWKLMQKLSQRRIDRRRKERRREYLERESRLPPEMTA